MAKRGPKKIKVNWEEFDKLCYLQCTLREIASWFDCSEDTIERRCVEEKSMKFADYYREKACKGKISLRRSQFQVASNGNVSMLIWLGKQYLGQSDKQNIVSKEDRFTLNIDFGDGK